MMNGSTDVSFIKRGVSIFWRGILGLVVAIGGISLVANFAYQFFTGEVVVTFVKPEGRGYVFNIENKSPVDQVIKSFRVVPDTSQKFVYKVTKNILAKKTEEGISIPGGNESYVPAFEFKGLNGVTVKAKSKMNFKIPSLSSREYLAPESAMMFVDYETASENKIVGYLEHLLADIQPRSGKKRVRYLVSENYWSVVNNDINAVKVACRDNDLFAKSSACN